MTLVHLEVYEKVKSWATLFLPESSKSPQISPPHKPSCPSCTRQVACSLSSTKKMQGCFYSLMIFGRSYLSRTKSVVPMAEQGQLRASTKTWWHLSRMNSSSSWLRLSLEQSPWWAVPAMVLSPNPRVWNTCDSWVPGVSRGSCARTGLCWSAVGHSVCFSYSYRRIYLSASFTCTCLFLTRSTNPCLWDSEPKNVSVFFFPSISTVLAWYAT